MNFDVFLNINNELIARQTEFFPAAYILTFVENNMHWGGEGCVFTGGNKTMTDAKS